MVAFLCGNGNFMRSLLIALLCALLARGQGTITYQTSQVPNGIIRNAQSKITDYPSVLDFGAKCDGTTVDNAGLIAAFRWTKFQGLSFPNGLCKFDNSMGPLSVSSYSGHLIGPNGAGIACTTLANGCIVFSSPTNLTID